MYYVFNITEIIFQCEYINSLFRPSLMARPDLTVDQPPFTQLVSLTSVKATSVNHHLPYSYNNVNVKCINIIKKNKN